MIGVRSDRADHQACRNPLAAQHGACHGGKVLTDAHLTVPAIVNLGQLTGLDRNALDKVIVEIACHIIAYSFINISLICHVLAHLQCIDDTSCVLIV